MKKSEAEVEDGSIVTTPEIGHCDCEEHGRSGADQRHE